MLKIFPLKNLIIYRILCDLINQSQSANIHHWNVPPPTLQSNKFCFEFVPFSSKLNLNQIFYLIIGDKFAIQTSFY